MVSKMSKRIVLSVRFFCFLLFVLTGYFLINFNGWLAFVSSLTGYGLLSELDKQLDFENLSESIKNDID